MEATCRSFPVQAEPVELNKNVAAVLSLALSFCFFLSFALWGLLSAEADRQNRVTNYLAACSYAYERSSIHRDRMLQLLFELAAAVHGERRKQRNAAQLRSVLPRGRDSRFIFSHFRAFPFFSLHVRLKFFSDHDHFTVSFSNLSRI